jgi:hypothetical protein
MKGPSMKQVERHQRQLLLDRQALLERADFRRVMQDFLEQAGIFRSSFAGEQTHSTAFNEGQRNAGNRMLSELEQANPNALALLRASAMLPETPDEDDVE